jgi:hypothetical protein
MKGEREREPKNKSKKVKRLPQASMLRWGGCERRSFKMRKLQKHAKYT